VDDAFGNALNLWYWVWCQWLPIAKDSQAGLHSCGRGVECIKELKKLAVDFFQLLNSVRTELAEGVV